MRIAGDTLIRPWRGAEEPPLKTKEFSFDDGSGKGGADDLRPLSRSIIRGLSCTILFFYLLCVKVHAGTAMALGGQRTGIDCVRQARKGSVTIRLVFVGVKCSC